MRDAPIHGSDKPTQTSEDALGELVRVLAKGAARDQHAAGPCSEAAGLISPDTIDIGSCGDMPVDRTHDD